MAKKTQSNPPAADSPSFEEALAQLDAIVDQLEGDGVPLESLVQHYDAGVKLLALCQERLENAKQRIDMIAITASGPVPTAPKESDDAQPHDIELF